ncbi:MAG: acetyl-CoA carboxylase carboxyl transferase subunit beta, partial [Aquificota bacterium]|nr:acetyl-CoA carboxylase carboxyl transferase subunit beta [Aquificota bacterium]
MSLSAVERVEQILDEEGAERLFEEVLPSDPLSFKDTKSYRDRLKKASKETGLSEAMVVVKGSVEGRKVI